VNVARTLQGAGGTGPNPAVAGVQKTRRGRRRVRKGNDPGENRAGYFCHVRFLWRLAFKRFRRLCLFIFRRRFFFRLPMVIACW
jgi:hypothetical protein